MLSRRQVLGSLALAGAAAGAGALSWWRRASLVEPAAGSCPAIHGGRIRWIVPHAAGGGYDAEARLIEPFLERRLQTQVVIDNLPGASGISGARTIASARPDGRTLGIIGAPGLLVAALTGTTQAPDPAAFTTLGRVSRSWPVWAAGRDTAFRTLDDAIAATQVRPLVFGLGDVGSVSFVGIAVTAALVGAPVTLVPGFEGSQAAALAAIRGDVDLVCFDFETVRDLIAAGELRPLLQISDRPIDPHSSLAGVPWLGGSSGWVATRHGQRDDEAGSGLARTQALIELVAAGRIVVAPPGMDPALARCLDQALAQTLSDPELQAMSTRPLDVATGERARADVLAAARDLPLLQPVLQDARRLIRG